MAGSPRAVSGRTCRFPRREQGEPRPSDDSRRAWPGVSWQPAWPGARTGRDWFQASLTAPTLRERVQAYARGVSGLMARAGDLIAIAWQAEPAEPVIAAAGRAGREATRDTVRLFCTRLRDDGLIPETCDITWLADTASLLSQAQTWLLGCDTLGWSSEQYSQWLAATLSRLIAATTAQA